MTDLKRFPVPLRKSLAHNLKTHPLTSSLKGEDLEAYKRRNPRRSTLQSFNWQASKEGFLFWSLIVRLLPEREVGFSFLWKNVPNDLKLRLENKSTGKM